MKWLRVDRETQAGLTHRHLPEDSAPGQCREGLCHGCAAPLLLEVSLVRPRVTIPSSGDMQHPPLVSTRASALHPPLPSPHPPAPTETPTHPEQPVFVNQDCVRLGKTSISLQPQKHQDVRWLSTRGQPARQDSTHLHTKAHNIPH